MLPCTKSLFPRFSHRADQCELEDVLPPASLAEVEEIEREVGFPLPDSYRHLLRCARGFSLMGGVVQFGSEHPFLHEFPALDTLTAVQQATVQRKGGSWPPPSDGMLCFAEFSMEADGDQVLFDVRGGLVNGDYPVVYYSHESRPPAVRVLASSFQQFMEEFLDYEGFSA